MYYRFTVAFLDPVFSVVMMYARVVHAGRNSMTAGHKVRGDHNARVKLTERLAPDEVMFAVLP